MGLLINVTYDSSVNSAPSGFRTAISYVVDYLESHFSDPININIAVGYGEVAGTALGTGALGESETFISSYSYSQIKNAVSTDAKSAVDGSVAASLPANNPTGGSFQLPTAEAKALGLAGASSNLDGYVGFSSTAPFDYSSSNRSIAGQYDFIGTAFHEMTEVMGRISDLSYGSFSVMDLLRYSAPNVRSLTPGRAAYFSIDGGTTNLDDFNSVAGGDYGDWAASAGNDSFLAYSNSGVANLFSSSDLSLMDALGYDPTSTPSPVAAITDTVTGGSGNDILYAPDVNTLLLGEGGDDLIVGGLGNDLIYSGDGLDSVYGGAGNDTIVGGAGFDLLEGGDGNDYLYNYAGGGLQYGGLGNDIEVGNTNSDVLIGDAGDDVAYGYGGNDYLYGGSGNDTMFGGDGVDVLLGGAGNDYFDGGQGVNYYFGGGGNNTFVSNDVPSVQVIQDFNAATDTVQFNGSGFTSFADVLSHSFQNGAYFVIQVDGDTAVWLNGATASTVSASNFSIVS